jgi:c-di-GMP-binding flagellar brake protein YcgR
MSPQSEQRRYPRMSVTGTDYGVTFKIKGTAILTSRLINLSAGGCGLEVAMADVRLVETGDLLEALLLDHPDLPSVPLSAVVMRMLGKVPGKTMGYVLVGVEFQGVTPFVRDLIAGHVAAQMTGE